MLARYAGLLTVVQDGQVKPGPVTVIVSGNRAVSEIAADNPRYVGLDGRLSDLDSGAAAHLMPLISDNWSSSSAGAATAPCRLTNGPSLARSSPRLTKMAAAFVSGGHPKQSRFGAELYEADVDLINSDDLAKLQQFLLSRR